MLESVMVLVLQQASHQNLGFQPRQKMDPQLRKLLEVSYEALLDAGLVIGALPSERVGVYIGLLRLRGMCCQLIVFLSAPVTQRSMQVWCMTFSSITPY